MSNQCLIIMPPGEPSGYPTGHVSRVYEYIIAPACRMASYWPNRMDTISHDSPTDVIKELIDSDVVLCDVSANNTSSSYAIAIRQALNLPVVLAKDTKSVIAFDTTIVEYDDSLRIDTVQKAIQELSDALKAAVETKKDRHELLDKFNIGLPEPAPVVVTPDTNTGAWSDSSADAPPQEEEKKVRVPIISPLPEYVGEPFTADEIEKLKSGDTLFHLSHGKGKINFIKKDKLSSIQFGSGAKFLVLAPSDFFRKVNE